MSSLSSFWKLYDQQQKDNRENSDPRQRITDRHAYVSFLESQLDKVNQNPQSYGNLQNELFQQSQTIQQLQDKVENLTRLIKLQQDYVETQETELGALKEVFYKTDIPALVSKKLDSMEDRIYDQIELRIDKKVSSLIQYQQRQEYKLQSIESQQLNVNSDQRWEAEERINTQIHKVNQRTLDELQALEKRMLQLIDGKYDTKQYNQPTDQSIRIEQLGNDMRKVIQTVSDFDDKLYETSKNLEAKYSEFKQQISYLEDVIVQQNTSNESVSNPQIVTSMQQLGAIVDKYTSQQRGLYELVQNLERRLIRIENSAQSDTSLNIETKPKRRRSLSPSFGAKRSNVSTIRSFDKAKRITKKETTANRKRNGSMRIDKKRGKIMNVRYK